ncbi:hypothetical protein QM858_02795 [Streptococcus infantis]|uniref:hypothetical protein n=1 Tax=Streptococcus infantis TaxID=68892 RepID=UPI0039C2C7BD
MSRKPKYQQDYEKTMEGMWWGVAVFIGAMYFLIKVTYYIALPFYTLFTNLFEEKMQQREYLNWMRFLPFTWFMTGVTKEIRRAAVSSVLLPIVLPLFLLFNHLFNSKAIGDGFALFIFILFGLSIGSVIGMVRNYQFSKKYIG